MSFLSGGMDRFIERSTVRDQCDLMPGDEEFLSEVELATNLIMAATEFDGRMPLTTIDRILGVQRAATSTY